MAKREQIYRLMLIAELLKRKPKGITYQEAKEYLEEKFHEKDWISELKFGEKTFERDRKLILELLGLESAFARSSKTFKIIDDETEVDSENVFDNIMLIDAYRQAKGNSEIMLFEKRKARGLNHLNGLLHAIQNTKIISLQYKKFWDANSQKRILEPYALKEFNYRWYLLANERSSKNLKIKTFGLDRVSDLEISNSSFVRKTMNVDDLFKNSFGIISSLDEKPLEIILSFDAVQGKYIKSLPLHHSQEIISDDEDKLIVKLLLVPTFDFVQQILSHGELVEVVSPKSFRNQMIMMIKQMGEVYNS